MFPGVRRQVTVVGRKQSLLEGHRRLDRQRHLKVAAKT